MTGAFVPGGVEEHESAERTSAAQWIALAGLLAAIGWVFLPTLIALEKVWRTDPDQTHGYFVIPFVAYLLWIRRHGMEADEVGWSIWGAIVLLLGLGLRFFGVFIYLDWLQAAAIVPCLVGVGMMIWGPATAWTSVGPLLFLWFMIPLPYRLATSLAYPLQRIATIGSTYLLETLGFYASSIGTKIHIGDHTLNVVAACSGLKILMTFFALSVAVALLQTQRPWWDRLAVILAAIPVALAANVIRIMTTAILYEAEIPWLAKSVYHDLAGWLMMPVALLLLGAWTAILRLCVAVDHRDVAERNFLAGAD